MKELFRGVLGQKLINYYHLCQAVLANLIYGFPSRHLRVVGVTGTDGKTTTVNLIASVLRETGLKASFVSSISAQIGDQLFDTGLHTTTPSPFLLQRLLKQMVEAGSEYVVLEVTSHALDQYRVWGIRFETAVLTNITPEHLDYHKKFKEYMKAKMRLFVNVKHAVYNLDISTPPPFGTLPRPGEGLKERSNRVVTFGFDPKAQIWADNIREDLESTSFQANIPDSKFQIRLNLPGKFNVLNALAAIAVGQVYNVSKEAITTGLAAIKQIPGRMEYIEAGQDFLAMVDFAHTPNALEALLRFVRPHVSGQLILVFGCAGERDPFKRPEMGRIAEQFAEATIITREDNRSEKIETICKQIASGITKKKFNQDYFVVPDRREAIRFALSQARKNDLVAVTGKGHEQSLNVDGREVPWDDRKVVGEELIRLTSESSRTSEARSGIQNPEHQKLYFTNFKGDRLAAILSVPDNEEKHRPLVIMAHGFNSSKDSEKYIQLLPILNDHGLVVFRFDFYGHGESEGKFEDITISEAVDDVLNAHTFAKKLGYKKIGLVGSSFGGLAAALAAAKLPDLSFLTLISPVSDYEEKLLKGIGEIARWKERGFTYYETGRGDRKQLNYSFYEDAVQAKSNAYNSTPKIICPTFIIHGDKDESVPVEQSQKLAKLILHCQLQIVKGADHRYTNPEHFERVIKLISKFIIRHSTPSPSPPSLGEGGEIKREGEEK